MTHTIKNWLISIVKPIAGRCPVLVVRLRYYMRFKRFPNLKNPQDLNEKILYLKLFSDTSRWTQLADKYRVRDYVRECGLENILIPLYGAWERVEDIPFDSLPQQFILKANNGDGKGTNVKVDKQTMTDASWQALRHRLHRWLTIENIGALSGEPQYQHIKPMIVAEQLLPCDDNGDSLVDYKLWCFNGEPHSFLVCSERQADGIHATVDCYDLEWNRHPENMQPTAHLTIADKPLPRPASLEAMIDAARRLSKPFPEVRVDLYAVGGKVYFGELTFTSLGGMMNYYTPQYLLEMGQHVTLPQ